MSNELYTIMAHILLSVIFFYIGKSFGEFRIIHRLMVIAKVDPAFIDDMVVRWKSGLGPRD